MLQMRALHMAEVPRASSSRTTNSTPAQLRRTGPHQVSGAPRRVSSFRSSARRSSAPPRCAVDSEAASQRKRPTAVQSSLVSNNAGPSGESGDSPNPDGDSVLDVYRRRATKFLADVDNAGFWSVGSGLLALNTFLLETVNDERFGGWDILYRDDINVFYYGLSTSSIGYLENVTTGLFALEFIARLWCADDKNKFFSSPITWIDGVSASPALLALLGVDTKIQRICRLLRVLRLLRLLEREPDSVLFGVMQSDNMSVQLIGVAAEFVCIFCVSAGVIYDLEYGVNENVHTLADTLYWAFLTLTGIGQPFEIETPAGKIATVLSVLVALIVVPGQLAKLAAASSGRMMMEAMKEEEQALANDFQIGAGVRIPKEQSVATKSRVAALKQARSAPVGALGPMGQMGRVGAELVAQEMVRQVTTERRKQAEASPGETSPGATVRRFRRVIVTLRTCENCDLEEHDLDACFCKSCGMQLPEVINPPQPGGGINGINGASV